MGGRIAGVDIDQLGRTLDLHFHEIVRRRDDAPLLVRDPQVDDEQIFRIDEIVLPDSAVIPIAAIFRLRTVALLYNLNLLRPISRKISA